MLPTTLNVFGSKISVMSSSYNVMLCQCWFLIIDTICHIENIETTTAVVAVAVAVALPAAVAVAAAARIRMTRRGMHLRSFQASCMRSASNVSAILPALKNKAQRRRQQQQQQ
uniref:Uncharacterized protein n=1 Tax=Glossina palpalis gambiensis TaxID=67801 RepID=A0A1B0ATE1_9MUSC